MAEQLLDAARDALDGPIDFEGQRRVEKTTTYALAAIGLTSFLIGYATQNMAHTLWLGLGGTAVTFLLVVPPWPYWNKSPVAWLPPKEGASNFNIQVDGVDIK